MHATETRDERRPGEQLDLYADFTKHTMETKT